MCRLGLCSDLLLLRLHVRGLWTPGSRRPRSGTGGLGASPGGFQQAAGRFGVVNRATEGPAPVARKNGLVLDRIVRLDAVFRIHINAGRLAAHIDAFDGRGGSWIVDGGILPTECDIIRTFLRPDDHGPCEASAAEDLVAATLVTVLHDQGVARPILLVNRLRDRYCLVVWLERVRTAPITGDRDPWEAFAEEAKFVAEFPTTGPSGKMIASLLDGGCLWRDILGYAQSRGYNGTKGAVRRVLVRRVLCEPGLTISGTHRIVRSEDPQPSLTCDYRCR